MDTNMHPDFPAALELVRAGDLEGLAEACRADPELIRKKAGPGKSGLLQWVVVNNGDWPDAAGACRVLIEAGAALEEPLVAAASVGATALCALLLDEGADVAGHTPWTPLDEALYWDKQETAAYLLEEGAPVATLRCNAALGRVEAVRAFVARQEWSPIWSPFPDTYDPGGSRDPQDVLDHAFVTAVHGGHREVADHLLQAGARINAQPPGYHWRGTALHAAVWRGDAGLVRWLLQSGADPRIRDGAFGGDGPGWARHNGHEHLLELLNGGD